jgi:holin-like protein
MKRMKILMQFAVIFVICLAGEALAGLLPVSFPGSVMAMVLLFALLLARVVTLRHIEQAADFLIANMAFFFVPLVVGIAESYALLSGQMGKIVLVCALSTVIAFGAAALAAGAVLKMQDRKNRP